MQEVGGSPCQRGALYLYQWTGISILATLWGCAVYSISTLSGPRSIRAVLPSVTSPHIYFVASLMKAVPKLLSVRPDAPWMWKPTYVLSYVAGLVFTDLPHWKFEINTLKSKCEKQSIKKAQWNDSIHSWKVFVLRAFFSHIPNTNIKLSPMTLEKSNNSFSCNGNIFVETYILFGNWLSVTTSNSSQSNGVIFQKWLEQNK